MLALEPVANVRAGWVDCITLGGRDSGMKTPLPFNNHYFHYFLLLFTYLL